MSNCSHRGAIDINLKTLTNCYNFPRKSKHNPVNLESGEKHSKIIYCKGTLNENNNIIP